MEDTGKAILDIPKQRYELSDTAVSLSRQLDSVVVEEPLEIALRWTDTSGAEQRRVFTITMRTPGDDEALALGLLHSEGLINNGDQIAGCHYTGAPGLGEHNSLDVHLAPGLQPDMGSLERNLVTQSSCGVCGKTSLQSVELMSPPEVDREEGWLATDVVAALPSAMRRQQVNFLGEFA